MTNIAVICLDETGSMSGQEHRVVSSMNEYVESLPDDTHVTVFTFNSDDWRTFFDGKKDRWRKMETVDYKPHNQTPLCDAIGKTIMHAESMSHEGDKVMVMIDTDGFENASREYTREIIKGLVTAKELLGWQFLFMANGVDEVAAMNVAMTGTSMGLRAVANSYGNRDASFTYASGATQSYFTGGK